MMKPTSSGSLMGVRKRMMESEPSKPSDSGMDTWMHTNSVVMASASSGNARATWLPVPRLS